MLKMKAAGFQDAGEFLVVVWRWDHYRFVIVIQMRAGVGYRITPHSALFGIFSGVAGLD